MLTLSVTSTRVVHALRTAALLLEREGWDPHHRTLINAIDRADGYQPGIGPRDAEETTVQAWNALADRVGVDVGAWERADGRTRADVVAALRAAAEEVAP